MIHKCPAPAPLSRAAESEGRRASPQGKNVISAALRSANEIAHSLLLLFIAVADYDPNLREGGSCDFCLA